MNVEQVKNAIVGTVAVACLIALAIGGYIFYEKYTGTKIAAYEAPPPEKMEKPDETGEAAPETPAADGLSLSRSSGALPDLPPAPKDDKPDIDEGDRGMFAVRVIKTGLRNPGGIAVHPEQTNLIYIAEEDTDRILVYDEVEDTLRTVVDLSTPIYENADESIRSAKGVSMPEGMCFSPDGFLFVAEDRSGGRLIKLKLADDGVGIKSGYVIDLPGDWSEYAWEDVAVGPNGELLLAGSTAQNAGAGDFLDIFVGTIVYKDLNDKWWIPYERKFASFSSVEFSKSGTHAVITGELSGEVSWIDLTSRRRLGGNSEHTARGAEGLCILPDGSLLIGLEEGEVHTLDPAVDRMTLVLGDLPAVEYVAVGPEGYRALVSDDKSGSLIEMKPLIKFNESTDKMNFATYRSILSQLHIPEDCPPYLAEVLKLGGLDYTAEDQPELTFREFTARVPMVAADAYAKPVPLHNFAKDPIEHLQFVVFEPNRITYTDDGVTLSLAGFYARTQSGNVIKSSTRKMAVRRLDIATRNIIPEGIDDFVVPHASSVTVSSTGVAAINFSGLGETPDFSIVVNPVDPEKSYLAVFYEDGRRDHYTLSLPNVDAVARSWIVAYSNDVHDEWKALRPVQP